MLKRKVSPNARCPCDSGKRYRECCSTKRFEWLVNDEGKQVSVEKDASQVIGEKISVYRMAQQSSRPEDEAVYRFLYRYLSEFSNADIMAFETYIDGERFDPAGAKKGPHVSIYGLFSIVLLLDTRSSLRTLRVGFQADLRQFVDGAARKLQKVFAMMKSEHGSKATPRILITRLNHCLAT